MTDQHSANITSIPMGKLFCPYCGTHLFSTYPEDVHNTCPHVVFAFVWGGDPDGFVAVRKDFAEAFIRELKSSEHYAQLLSEDEREPIDENSENVFVQGAFEPLDDVAVEIGSFCDGFPENMFPELPTKNTILFVDDRLYDGIHIAVDWGTEDVDDACSFRRR